MKNSVTRMDLIYTGSLGIYHEQATIPGTMDQGVLHRSCLELRGSGGKVVHVAEMREVSVPQKECVISPTTRRSLY
jgi:hypothetical protein